MFFKTETDKVYPYLYLSVNFVKLQLFVKYLFLCCFVVQNFLNKDIKNKITKRLRQIALKYSILLHSRQIYKPSDMFCLLLNRCGKYITYHRDSDDSKGKQQAIKIDNVSIVYPTTCIYQVVIGNPFSQVRPSMSHWCFQ